MENLLLAILVGLALGAVRLRDLLGASAVLGVYSLVMAILWCTMHALDVAFTEAAVGAGISTVLLLTAIHRVGRHEARAGLPLVRTALIGMRERARREHARGGHSWSERFEAWGVCVLVAGALVYGVQGMPAVGDPDAPASTHPQVARRYLEASPDVPGRQKGEVGPANVVTSVLGDYRGYDTLGETVVIFTAALCVLQLLRYGRPRRDADRSGEAGDAA